MKSLVKYFIIGFKEIFSNKILIISLSVVNLFLISGVVYKAVNNKKELNKYEDLKRNVDLDNLKCPILEKEENKFNPLKYLLWG